MIPASEALERLREGNRRFMDDVRDHRALTTRQTRRDELVSGQQPHAVVLGCSDSRVPVEIIFDQCLGDLFVIRVAGNVVARSQIGSVEYAASALGVRLVVVLGHSKCGAVTATVDELLRPPESRSPNIGAIVDRIRPSVEGFLDTDLRNDHDELVSRAVKANIDVSVDRLRHGSRIIEDQIRDDGLVVVGAEYSLETGLVEFHEPR